MRPEFYLQRRRADVLRHPRLGECTLALPELPGARKNNGSSAIIDGYVHYGPFASFGGRSARQMHPATCTTCSQTTEVPFVPKDGRPVYCAECFGMMRRVTGDEHAAPRGIALSR